MQRLLMHHHEQHLPATLSATIGFPFVSAEYQIVPFGDQTDVQNRVSVEISNNDRNIFMVHSCCHDGKAIAIVHPVHLMNID